MPTCKDCIHIKICTRYVKLLSKSKGIDFDNAIEQYCEKVEADKCEYFQDRSKFIELPCKVGDTVYMIIGRTEKVRRKKVTEHIIVKCGVDNFRIGDAGYPSAALCDTDNNWYYGIEPSNFGDFVFLTRKEAEQALNNHIADVHKKESNSE